MELLKLVARDGLELSAALFLAEDPKALVQIIHGAREHKERYYDFCRFLNEQGYAVIVSDNRGHGESVNGNYPLGYMDGFEQIVEDQRLVTHHIRSLYPGKKLVLFGHSLGSVFARIYLREYDADIHKLILSGTVPYVPGVGFGINLARLLALICGKRKVIRLLHQLALRKDDIWISKNRENLENYRKDPRCQFLYPIQSVLTIFLADRELHRLGKYRCQNPDLPILSVSGSEDPITGGAKGLRSTVRSLQRIGYRNVTNTVYPGMKHEVLNEDNREMVYRDILAFLEQ